MILICLFSLLLGIVIYFTLKSLRPSKHIDPIRKAVLITGCDTGFGHQLALRAKSAGFLVFAGCLKLPDANGESDTDGESDADDGNSEGAGALRRKGCHVFLLDVTKQTDVDEAVQYVEKTLAETDAFLWAVVNNAGIAMDCELEWCTAADLTQMLDINTVGPFRVAKAFLPILRRNPTPGKRVVNVASTAALFTLPGVTFYSMSKHANRSMSDGMRREWSKFQIHVSSIEPTLYKTNICNLETLAGKLRSKWSAVSEETKAAYGDLYVSEYEEMMIKKYECGSDQIWEVIDGMMDSITNSEPQRHYNPGLPLKIRLFILRCLPEFILDNLFTKQMPDISKH